MAFEPANRYQSARELALDLEHWIADEPVAAYPERRLQRLSRWLRRHRSWTYAGAAALVGITAVATAALFFVDRAPLAQEEARKEAEANFQIAQQAADDYAYQHEREHPASRSRTRSISAAFARSS